MHPPHEHSDWANSASGSEVRPMSSTSWEGSGSAPGLASSSSLGQRSSGGERGGGGGGGVGGGGVGPVWPEPQFVLLVSSDCVRLYTTAGILQVREEGKS